MSENKVAVYPGSFDPITNGHISVLKRALAIFDHVYVAVASNDKKECLFTSVEREELAKEALKNFPNVTAERFDGLLVDYCKKRNARVMIRGLRAVSDFDHEFQLALVNRRLDKNIETVFFMTSYKYSYLSSSLIRSLAKLKGDFSGLVPENIEKKIMEKF